MKVRLLPLAVCLVAGCGARPHRLADGSYKLDCEATMAECSRQVAKFCRGEGYRIVHGAEENTLVGVEGHKTGHLLSRVVFYCARDAPPTPLKLPPRAPAEPAGSVSQRVCVPGSTQRCVGPGACEGGQACLKDGSGYGPCECAREPAAPDGGAVDAGLLPDQ
jgi:hypothetical protein